MAILSLVCKCDVELHGLRMTLQTRTQCIKGFLEFLDLLQPINYKQKHQFLYGIQHMHYSSLTTALFPTHICQTHNNIPHNYLENGKIFQHTVHHVLFGQMFQLMNKINHVFTHGRPMNSVDEPSILKSWVLSFHFLHHLLPK